MEGLITLLQQWIEDPQTLRLVVVVLMSGTFVIFGLGLGFLALSATDPIRRRLSRGAKREVKKEKGRTLVWINTMLGPVSSYVLPQSEIERDRINQKLVHAGFRSPSAVQNFYAIKVVLAIMLPAIVLLISRWLPNLTTQMELIAIVGACGAGMLMPNMVLDRLMQNRKRKLRNGFPDALDMLVVCVEAGLGMSQAIQRVADELGVSHPELAQELALVNAEIRAGVDRVAALKNLAYRTGLEDVQGLVSLLVQTLRFGTSIAESLRVYSVEFRDKRMQKAEEQAAKIGTKMVFPLVIFLFPGFFVVAVGPAVVGLVSVFQTI
ncbi:MAG TPA: type II secretion system F family protein [Gammaproteobacteria bacterium]